MTRSLLIVESPAKSKTITKYLGSDFEVLASYGHLRDLEHSNRAVDPEHDFAMAYEVPEKSTRHVEDILRAARKASTIYLATDLDREGEAISWHILQLLEEKGLTKGKTIHRVTFAEITEKAIKAAVANPRQINQAMVDAQQARRALDYLVGYRLSPVLWKKVKAGLSAGRVQSPALRMIVERAEEIERFNPMEYWTLTAQLDHPTGEFPAKLHTVHGKRWGQFYLETEDATQKVRRELLDASGGWLTVSDVASKERLRRPVAPFTTSTLQQEAARKLGFSVTKTMKAAQQLYEGINLGTQGQVGLITYMRTDAVVLSQDALDAVRGYIRDTYGNDSLPSLPNVYTAKTKNAQEAHEAIRPTSFSRSPEAMAKYLDRDQQRLYELIWKRTVACQMIPATLRTVSIDFALPNAPGGLAMFRTTGSTVIVPGFLAVYEEGRDHAKNDDDENRRLPPLAIGDRLQLLDVVPAQHFTEPPPAYSEASLVKSMEEHGIGRPSTYASTIQTLLNREYIHLDNRKFVPTDIGRAVSHFLTQHFTQYVDYDFTARLEDDLDGVARGEDAWIPLMHRFWEPFAKLIAEKVVTVERDDAQGNRQLGTDPVSGRPISARLSKYGPVVQIGKKEDEEKPKWASIPESYSIHSITLEQALDLFKLPRVLGNYDGGEVIANRGRFGAYVRGGGVTASLEATDDPMTVTLERAIDLIQGKLAYQANRIARDFGDGIQAINGRFGVYLHSEHTKVNGKIPKGKDVSDLSKEEVIQILETEGQAPRKGGKWNRKGGKPQGGFAKGKKGSGKPGKGGRGTPAMDDLP